MLLRICMIGWLCIALPWSVWPQQLPAKSPVGALGIGYAVGEQAWLQTKYIYRIAIWMPEVRLTLHRRGAWERAFIGQSQLVFAEHWPDRLQPGKARLWEAGLSGGILVGCHLLRGRLHPYLGFTFGPQYLSASIPRQIKGLAFSSQLFPGIRCKLGRSWEVDLRGGFRHVSNAGLWAPNGGINNSYLRMGLLRTFAGTPGSR